MNHQSDQKAKPQSLPTRRDAAARLNVCTDTVDAYIKRGLLRKITLSPRAVRIDPTSLERLATGRE